MSKQSTGPARVASEAMTDTLVRAMEDASSHEYTRCVVLTMNDDGIHRGIYSNARSEPEMFGMIAMADQVFTENILEDSQ